MAATSWLPRVAQLSRKGTVCYAHAGRLVFAANSLVSEEATMRWFGWVARMKPDVAPSDGSPHGFRRARAHRRRAVRLAPRRGGDESPRLPALHPALCLQRVVRGAHCQASTILDVGTGTGRWASRWPNSTRRRGPWAPTSRRRCRRASGERRGRGLTAEQLRVFAGNVLEGLPFPDASFDFVHQRLLFLAIPAARWPSSSRN